MCLKASYEDLGCPHSTQGPNITLAITGGYCALRLDKKVVCEPPRVVLRKTQGMCTFKHLTATEVVVCDSRGP
jgi:hypothetical protein